MEMYTHFCVVETCVADFFLVKALSMRRNIKNLKEVHIASHPCVHKERECHISSTD